MSDDEPDTTQIARRADGKWSGSGNPAGKPANPQFLAIERMINGKHRTPDQVNKALKAALEYGCRGDKGDAAYLKLWLERVLGPVKELDIDLSDAPPDVVAYLKTLQ